MAAGEWLLTNPRRATSHPAVETTAAFRVGATQHSVGPIAATLEDGEPLEKN